MGARVRVSYWFTGVQVLSQPVSTTSPSMRNGKLLKGLARAVDQLARFECLPVPVFLFGFVLAKGVDGFGEPRGGVIGREGCRSEAKAGQEACDTKTGHWCFYSTHAGRVEWV